MSCNCHHKAAVNKTKYPEKSMNLKKHVAYHREADTLSGNAVPHHHTDRIAKEGRYKGGGERNWEDETTLLYTEMTTHQRKRKNKDPNELKMKHTTKGKRGICKL
jgi:hypothetical protein